MILAPTDWSFDEATNTWWYFNGGAIDFAFDGMALNDYGWWKVNNGSVNFGFNGLCSNEYGTWKFNGGTVDFGYNGFAADGENTWYVVNGRVATEYSGTVDGKAVRNGQVMDTVVIQVAHHGRDTGTGAVTDRQSYGTAGFDRTWSDTSNTLRCR